MIIVNELRSFKSLKPSQKSIGSLIIVNSQRLCASQHAFSIELILGGFSFLLCGKINIG